ncbi:MAG: amidohydrolase family protein, partial [Bacteroidales bacterium]|nr:amidohydrolase family protein [Bacteroidales bacterium]
HYMLLGDRDYTRYGSLMKCNPSIKKQSDREAIIQAVRDGVIKVVATDHAPHTYEEKSGDYLNTPSGLPLVQHSFQIMWDLHKEGAFCEHTVVDRMSHSPAKNFNIDRRGFLREGYYADIMVFDPSKPDNKTTFYPAYKCGWSPFRGRTFSSSVIHTFVNGVHVVSEGMLTGAKGGKQLVFKHGK